MTFWHIVFVFGDSLPTNVDDFLSYRQNRENARAACAGLFIGKGRNSRSKMFFKIGGLKNFAIFTGKHLCWSLFLIKFYQYKRKMH